MADTFTFQRFEEQPMLSADAFHGDTTGYPSPRTDPLAMDARWYALYDPTADDIMREEFRPYVEAVRPLLAEELSAANAPYTGRETACVLTTQLGKVAYGGHSEESGIGRFVRAPAMALARLHEAEPDNAKIDGVYLMGRNLEKPKHVMPRPEDYDNLARHFLDWGPTIITVSPDDDDYECIWASTHAPAYSTKEFSDFSSIADIDGWGTESVIDHITEHTILSPEDARFVAELMYYGMESGIGIYLIGSASGRGEISNALKDSYEDIDLLVVAGDQDLGWVEMHLARIAESHFGPVEAIGMTSYNYRTGEGIPGIYLCDTEGNKRVQLHIGHTMGDINIRPDNLLRNFYHKVS